MRSEPIKVMEKVQEFIGVDEFVDFNELIEFNEKKKFYCVKPTVYQSVNQSINRIKSACLGSGKGRVYEELNPKTRSQLNTSVD